jgi:hypothetical protein
MDSITVAGAESAVLIGVAGYTAWSNTLIGGAPPIVRAYYERASHPRPGDLVVETSSLGLRIRDGRQPETCVGILERRTVETLPYLDDDGNPDPEGGAYDEEAWYIRLLVQPEAEPYRWTNATFVAIPRTMAEMREFRGERVHS